MRKADKSARRHPAVAVAGRLAAPWAPVEENLPILDAGYGVVVVEQCGAFHATQPQSAVRALARSALPLEHIGLPAALHYGGMQHQGFLACRGKGEQHHQKIVQSIGKMRAIRAKGHFGLRDRIVFPNDHQLLIHSRGDFRFVRS